MARALADNVCQAFSHRISTMAAAVPYRRWARLGLLTGAVADGIAAVYRRPIALRAIPKRPPPRVWRLVLVAVAIYALLRPALGLGHELAVCGIAALLHAIVATNMWQPPIGWLGLDPIYTGAAVRAAGGVQIAGLAVGGLVGSWLHALLPTLILGPDHVARDAGVSMVAVRGAPALGRGLAGFGADVMWLIVGVSLVKGWGGRYTRVALVGLLIQGQIVVNHLLDAQLSIPDLEASGLPFALAVAAPGTGGWFSQDLEHMPDDPAHGGGGWQPGNPGVRVARQVCYSSADACGGLRLHAVLAPRGLTLWSGGRSSWPAPPWHSLRPSRR